MHGFGLIAEAAGPGQQGAHRNTVALHLNLCCHHVARVEAEGLHHVQAVGSVVERDGAGSLENARGRVSASDSDLIKGLVQLFGQLRLVGVERERQTEGSGLCIDQVKLLAVRAGMVLVLAALQNPVLNLRALIGEDNLQVRVLHRCLRDCGGDDGWSSNWRLHLSGG